MSVNKETLTCDLLRLKDDYQAIQAYRSQHELPLPETAKTRSVAQVYIGRVLSAARKRMDNADFYAAILAAGMTKRDAEEYMQAWLQTTRKT